MSTETSDAPETIRACPQHPDAAAAYVCAECGSSVCIDCCFTMPDQSVCCKRCLDAKAAPAASEPAPLVLRMAAPAPIAPTWPSIPLLPGTGCVQHPDVRPSAHCKYCGIGVCRTCDFVFPGELHLCPVCATTSTARLSPRRKSYLIAAFALAGWSSLGLSVLVSGALAGMVEDRSSQTLVGIMVILFIALPSVVGTAMAMSAMRKGANTIAVWIAMVWNVLMLAGFAMLMIIGTLSK